MDDGTGTTGGTEGGAGTVRTATRCGVVALIGAPNAGKSTLVNALVGTKVSIVTRKVQTTRGLVRGIVLAGDAQVILVDTPGIFAPRRRLDRAMVSTAWSSAHDADLVACLVDARRGLDEEVRRILLALADVRVPKVLVLTKVDVTRKERLLEIAAEANAIVPFDETFMVSATSGSGLADLSAALARRMPDGPWLFPEDQVSDLPMRQLAAEVTREHLMNRVHDELPYEATVETEGWTEQKDGSVRIEQVIYVARDSQKRIVLGAKGQTVKAISMAARGEIASMLERPVHLFLFVKVRENWGDDPERYREMGLEFPR